MSEESKVENLKKGGMTVREIVENFMQSECFLNSADADSPNREKWQEFIDSLTKEGEGYCVLSRNFQPVLREDVELATGLMDSLGVALNLDRLHVLTKELKEIGPNLTLAPGAEWIVLEPEMADLALLTPLKDVGDSLPSVFASKTSVERATLILSGPGVLVPPTTGKYVQLGVAIGARDYFHEGIEKGPIF